MTDAVLVLGTVLLCGLGGLLVLFRALRSLERLVDSVTTENRALLEANTALRSVEAAQHLAQMRAEAEGGSLSLDGPDDGLRPL